MPDRHLNVPADAAAEALLEKLAVLDTALDAARAALGAIRAALDVATAPGDAAGEVVPTEVNDKQPATPTAADFVTHQEPPVAVEAPAALLPKPLPMHRSYFLDFQ